MNKSFVLTGGIGSGKSTVLSMLSEKGFEVKNLDTIAHRVLQSNSRKVRALFGDEVIKFESTVDRKKLGAIVFNDPTKMELLEDLLYSDIEEEIRKCLDGKMNVIIECAVFYEKSKRLPQIMQLLPVISVIVDDDDVRIQRIIQRDDLTAEEARLRMDTQVDDSYHKDHSHYVIVNDGDVEKLQKQVDEFYIDYIESKIRIP